MKTPRTVAFGSHVLELQILKVSVGEKFDVDQMQHVTQVIQRIRSNVEQDVFVKHECPLNGHFLRNVTFIFDLDLCR